jgi:hypothetical protein
MLDYSTSINPEYPNYSKDKNYYGCYMLSHPGSKKIYVNVGDVVFNRYYDEFLLLLGIHYNVELQLLYNNDNRIQFNIYKIQENQSDSIEDARRLIKLITKFDKSLNKSENITITNYAFQHPHVDNVYLKNSFRDDINYDVSCVYMLLNKDTKEFYIGSGEKRIRRKDHFHKLKNNEHRNLLLQSAYNKNSKFEFYYIPIKSRKEAYALEQILVDRFWGNPLLLNMSRDVMSGSSVGRKHTDETKEKCRQAKIRYFANITKEAKEEWIKNLSSSLIGNKHCLGNKLSEEHKKKILESRKRIILERGYYHSNETIEKQRISNLGKKRSEETKEKIRLSRIDKHPNEETRRKLSIIRTGRKHSKETLNKILSCLSKNWEKRKKLVSINGIIYNGVGTAAKALGISQPTVSRMLSSKSTKYKDCFFVE